MCVEGREGCGDYSLSREPSAWGNPCPVHSKDGVPPFPCTEQSTGWGQLPPEQSQAHRKSPSQCRAGPGVGCCLPLLTPSKAQVSKGIPPVCLAPCNSPLTLPFAYFGERKDTPSPCCELGKGFPNALGVSPNPHRALLWEVFLAPEVHFSHSHVGCEWQNNRLGHKLPFRSSCNFPGMKAWGMPCCLLLESLKLPLR